ncbi:hypothetical protein BDZ45DRAFT_673549 [Acephala macrosclerotiorum]|nr:hypothetical protein BDZ45DRAFT_673549 [Acephala macrosclerotiorum]
MPCRRSHSKSRNGCKQCKRRKVKCDEEHPKCKPCTKRGIWCSFQEPLLDDKHSTSSTPLRTLDFPDDIEIPPDISLSVRTLELKLMHHFSTITCTTLCEEDEPHGLYHFQVLTPNLALSHPFLLETLMTLTALHLAHLDASIRESWTRIAMTYHDRALVGFNEALANITPSNCEAATLCSIFVLIITIAVMGISQRNDERSLDLDPVAGVVGLRKLLQGVEIILMQSENIIMRGEFREWFRPMFKAHAEKGRRAAPDTSLAQKYWESNPQDSGLDLALYHSLLESLTSLQAHINTQPTPHTPIYQTSTQYLLEALQTLPSRHYLGSMLTWCLRLDQSILSLLEEKDKMAGLIFVHWGVALHLIRNEWFAGDAGAQIVRTLLLGLEIGNRDPAIDPALHNGQGEFERVVEWARSAVEGS